MELADGFAFRRHTLVRSLSMHDAGTIHTANDVSTLVLCMVQLCELFSGICLIRFLVWFPLNRQMLRRVVPRTQFRQL